MDDSSSIACYSAWVRTYAVFWRKVWNVSGSLNYDIQTYHVLLVEEVMELVELTPLREAIVGLPGVSGLSTEQQKRLTIAIKLVANPSIIFLDELPSGHDARAAAFVMRAIRNTVNMGRTVVCTIHQPRCDIFEAFDEAISTSKMQWRRNLHWPVRMPSF